MQRQIFQLSSTAGFMGPSSRKLEQKVKKNNILQGWMIIPG